jgi:cysteine-rich repeat protein
VGGDGCSVACKVELGYTCLGGTPATKDTCKEICGDALNRGSFGCDDGNLVAGDGCDGKCAVEFGWKCNSLTTLLASYCYKISWPRMIDWWIDKNNTNLYIKFNETVVVSALWKYSDWTITIDGPIPPY